MPCTALVSQGAVGVVAVASINVLIFLKLTGTIHMQYPLFGPSETNTLLMLIAVDVCLL